MPDLTFPFPQAAHITRLVEAVCREYGWDATSGETKQDYFRRWQKDQWRAITQRSEARRDRDAVPTPANIEIT